MAKLDMQSDVMKEVFVKEVISGAICEYNDSKEDIRLDVPEKQVMSQSHKPILQLGRLMMCPLSSHCWMTGTSCHAI